MLYKINRPTFYRDIKDMKKYLLESLIKIRSNTIYLNLI